MSALTEHSHQDGGDPNEGARHRGNLVAVPEPLVSTVATRGSTGTSADDLTVRTIGNAVVVHPEGRLSEEARLLALTVARDTRYQLVVLDLPEGSTAAAWDRVATLLPRPRRGLRLVVRGRSREASTLAAHWLAARLGRPVIAPDGHVSTGFGGSLFVDPTDGGGWMRFQGKKAATFVGTRFPRPAWESEAFSAVAVTSAAAHAEPLPAGMWLHGRGDDERVQAHRDRLRRGLPCQQDLVPLVLGCPGEPPLSLDEVARFWRTVPEEVRPRLRPLRYGPVATADGRPWGQALADLLGEDVVCYAGIVAGSVVEPDVHTVTDDGVLGWNSAARELGYSPSPGVRNTTPRLVSHRPPLAAAHEVSPAVYWYAPDAVVEVVQSGLWIRPPAEPVDAEAVRAVPAQAGRHFLVVDDRDPEQTPRMRQLAADVAEQLDHATRRLSELQPASVLARVQTGTVPPGLHIAGRPAAVTAAPSAPAAPADPAVALGVHDPKDEQAPAPRPEPVRPAEPAFAPAAAPTFVDAPVNFQPPAARVDAPPSPVASADQPVPAAPRPATPPAPEPAARPANLQPAVPAVPPANVQPPAAPEGLQPPAPPVPPADVHPPAPAAPPVSFVPPAPAAPAAPVSFVPPAPAAAPAPAALSATDGRPAESAALGQWQPTPTPDSAGLLPDGGLDKERGWLTKAMSRQYASTANGVSRVLSENPAFSGALSRGHGEVLTDAVAVRLFLGPDGDDLTTSLRSAAPGPHVPFARCVASGLTRLPTHRGVTATALTAGTQQWEQFRQRRQFTEWGFLEMLTTVCPEDTGDTDVLVWSLTGRRARLMEPEADRPDRVCFLPGTRFTVLDAAEPAAGRRGYVLLREIASVEVDDDGAVGVKRSALDDLAAASLRRALDERKSDSARPEQTGRAPRTLPGLVEVAGGAA